MIPQLLVGRPGPNFAPWNAPLLKQLGIGGVVSLDGPIRTADLAAAGIEHLPAYQPMLLLPTEKDQLRFLSVMPRILAFFDNIQARRQAIMIHCHYGCDRTGSALACCLVARQKMDAESAILTIQRLNPDALWVVGYADAVYTFEESYRQNPDLYDGSPLP